MNVEMGIPERSREAVVQLLNDTLSDEYVLLTKARNCHWNVVGPLFHELHQVFQAHYEELNEIVDEVAERVRALGGWPRATLAEFLHSTRLKENPGEYPSAEEMVSSLLADHEALVRSLRGDAAACAETFGDIGTNDFLTSVMRRHEKMAWGLRAMLESHAGAVRTGPPPPDIEREPSRQEEHEAVEEPEPEKAMEPTVPTVAKKKAAPRRRKKTPPAAPPKEPEESETDETVMMKDADADDEASDQPEPKTQARPKKRSGPTLAQSEDDEDDQDVEEETT